MEYIIQASGHSNNNASVSIKKTSINFGTTADSEDTLANPAELFISSFAACILKNVERFSGLMKFTYSHSEIEVTGIREEKPSRISKLFYSLSIHTTAQNINTDLLKRNIEKFGTIYNTIEQICEINGSIVLVVE